MGCGVHAPYLRKALMMIRGSFLTPPGMTTMLAMPSWSTTRQTISYSLIEARAATYLMNQVQPGGIMHVTR